MKCKCFSNNNYEVIGLCDIKRFNKKISEFKDKSWAQVILSEKSKITSNKLSIKSITKVYLNIKIISTKIIKTHFFDSSNVEGLKINGKLLLVLGEIYENIIYISDTRYNSVHSLDFKIPFSTCIVIDKNTDLNNDSFCIYPCIENVFINMLDERTLNRSINLFLFAHKITSIIEIKKSLSAFIFNTFDTDEEMVKIEFDENNKKLIVTSTGKSYNTGKQDVAFSFKLVAFDGKTMKKYSKINQNENADSFKDELNDSNFEFGDIISIDYNDKTKVKLINYPTQGNIYNMLNANKQSFKITNIIENKIIPYVLDNRIILNDIDNNPVVVIQFGVLSKDFLVNSTGNITNIGGRDYFKMTLYESDGIKEKVSQAIAGNQNGDAFSNFFSKEEFEFEDVLKLEYEEANKVKITNLLKDGEEHTPPGTENKYQITKNGLIEFIEKLLNTIIIKSKNNQEVVKIELHRDSKKIVVSSTRTIIDQSSNDIYFTLILKNQLGSQNKLMATLISNQDASNFKIALNNKTFDYNDELILIYKDKTKIQIIDYPAIGEKYIPNFNANVFKITLNGLVDKTYNNKIKIFNDQNKEIASIYFIKYNSDFKVFSTFTGAISTDAIQNDKIYAECLNYESTGINFRGEMFGKENGDNFVNQLNDKRGKIGFPIRIFNKVPNRVVITNYKGVDEYKIGEEFEFLKSNGNELVPYNQTYNKIRFKNRDNTTIAFVYFDKLDSNTIYVEPLSTGIINKGNFLDFEILDPTQKTIKLQIFIDTNKNANTVIWNNQLPGNISSNIKFGDLVQLNYIEPSLIEASEFPDSSKNFILKKTRQTFIIKSEGLTPLNENIIIIKSKNDEEVVKIEFNENTKQFKIFSTGIVPDQSSNDIYFNLILKDDKGIQDKVIATLLSNENATTFRAILNNRHFSYDDELILVYKDKTKIEITDYPIKGQKYIPNFSANVLKITLNGLVDKTYNNKIKIFNDENKEVCTTYFINYNSNFKLLSIFTDAISTNTIENDKLYAECLSYKSNGISFRAEMFGKENGYKFVKELNEKKGVSNFPIRLFNKISNRIAITNYREMDEYRIGEEFEFLKSNGNELIPYNQTYNKIRFKNRDNTTIVFIYFDKVDSNTIYVEPLSTGIINKSNFLDLEILDSTQKTIKFQIFVGMDETANNIIWNKNPLPGKISSNIKFGDVVQLNYIEPFLIEVSQFPDINKYFTLSGTRQMFTITRNGLTPLI